MPDLRSPIALKYFFTLRPQVDPCPVGDVPGGYRVDLRYSGAEGSVSTKVNCYRKYWLNDTPIEQSAKTAIRYAVEPSNGVTPDLYDSIRAARQKTVGPSDSPLFPLRRAASPSRLDWFGVEGEIASGADWVTVREDGVAMFDGRVTLRADKSFLIDAVLSGVVDLRGPHEPMPDPDEKRSPSYARWLLGALAPDPIPVVLTVRFEAAQTAGNWARQELLDGSRGYWKFERLVRGQFLAVGTVTLQNARYSPISEVKLDIYEVRATPEGECPEKETESP